MTTLLIVGDNFYGEKVNVDIPHQSRFYFAGMMNVIDGARCSSIGGCWILELGLGIWVCVS